MIKDFLICDKGFTQNGRKENYLERYYGYMQEVTACKFCGVSY